MDNQDQNSKPPGSQRPDDAKREKLQDILLKANDHYRQGHRFRAGWYYRKALKIDPENIAALVNLALLLSTKKKSNPVVLDMLRKAESIEPENPTILLNLATFTAHSGEWQEALSLLEKAESIQPQYPDLHYNKAHVLAMMGKNDKALEEVHVELERNPGNLNAVLMKEAIENRIKGSNNAEKAS